MNIYLIIILFILIAEYILDVSIELLNLRHLKPHLPRSFQDVFDQSKYTLSQQYLKANTRLGLFRETVNLIVILALILGGGFNMIDHFVRGFGYDSIISGILFFGILILLSSMFSLPFRVYQTFVIEETFGFNRTTVRTFILDTVKGLVLLALIGVPLGYAILLFFERTGPYAPLWVWLVIVIFQLFMIYIAPVAILPLFNRYTPIEEGDLKSKISAYAESQGFKLKGIYTMDGSRRSRKSNAFFTGFGRFRRIVLFDTLVEKHDSDELLAILAHEIGHYKLNHIKKRLFYSVLELGISLFILSKFLNNPQLFEAFQMEDISVYASLLFFGFIYSPVSTITSVLSNRVSRSHEFDADSYSVQTLKLKNAFISALKKLSADNLSNLTPHRLKVFFDYSHPPVLDRIKSIEEIDVN